MMHLLRQSVDKTIVDYSDISIMLPRLRDTLKQFIFSDEFRLLCVDAIVSSFEEWDGDDRSWNPPAIICNDELLYSVNVICWPAFYENNPHQHKTWSVTGVLSNTLEIKTYSFHDDCKMLKRDRLISVKAGEVGYLLPGCIHSVCNPSHELSASIHIFNRLPGVENSEDNAIWYPAPRKYNLSQGLVERVLRVCLSMLSEINNQKSLELIDRIFVLAPMPIKLLSVYTLTHLGNNHAPEYLGKIESMLRA